MPHVDIFLEQFLKEIISVSNEGIKMSNRSVKLIVTAFICDAPARADLKRIVGHAAYFSCERCIQKGVMASHHVALLECDAAKRTDESYLTIEHSEHHKEGPISTISNLGIGMVSSFPLDYMHLCCLGISKRLMVRWTSSKKMETKCHLSALQRDLLEKQLHTYSLHVPSEFRRKLNSGFHNFKFWKATEFRQFLVYAGIVVLKDILPDALYDNFLHLAISMRLLLTKHQDVNMENVSTLLKTFVQGAKKMYGNGFVSYNVHCVLHLPEDYCHFGALDNISCFPFENYLGVFIKGRLTGRNKPLQQINRHVSNENNNFQPHNSDCKDTDKHFFINNILFTKQSFAGRNNCILTNTGKIGYITSFHDDKFVMTEFASDSLFTKPCNSQDVWIYKLTFKKSGPTEFLRTEIFSKVILVPQKEYFVAIAMLNFNN